MSDQMNSMRWAARLLLLPLLILNFAAFARAEERPSVFLEDLTWTELRDAIGAGKTTIIVPIGGTEQNGPAMALGKHNRRVKLLCERIAVALGNALVAPVIAYVPEGAVSPPSGHMRFPGTISVPEAAFEAIFEFRRPELQTARVQGYRLPGRSWRLPGQREDRGEQTQPRMGLIERARARGDAILRGGASRFRPDFEGSRVYARRRSEPMRV